MTDIVLNEIRSGYNLSKINDNFEKIEDVVNTEVIHSTGDNNVMGQDLDLNSNRILNLPTPINDNEPLRLGDANILAGTREGGSTISEEPPVLKAAGDRWTRCSDMKAFLWYEDGDSGQWIEDRPSYGIDTIQNLSIPYVFDTVADMAASTIVFPVGKLLRTVSYYGLTEVDNSGSATYKIVTPAEFGATPDEWGYHTLANGNIAKLIIDNGTVSVKQFGAKGDNATDDTLPLQAALNVTSYLNLIVEGGVYRTSAILYPLEGCYVDFLGTIKFLDSLSPPPTSVIRLREPNITLNNPKLDGNKDGIPDPGGNGQYAVLAAYPAAKSPTDCKVIGGTLENGWHNIIQGGGKELLVSGTRIKRAGEHLIYISEPDGVGGTTGSKITFENSVLEEPDLVLA